MKNNSKSTIIFLLLLTIFSFLILITHNVKAGTYDGEDLALAILKDQSTLISSSYEDNDQSGCRQAKVITSSLGTMIPTNGNEFILLSTGIAGYNPVTTDQQNPGDERGTWFRNRNGNPRDFAKLIMNLRVPDCKFYLYYDIQFFSSEFPEYIGTKYNDRFSVTVSSPTLPTSEFIIEVNSGYFVLYSNNIAGTGFDIYAQSGNPEDVDIVDTTPREVGTDAGASDLIPIGGIIHPVIPGEIITITFHVLDVGDNMFDSTVFIDNLRFSDSQKANITGLKSVNDINGGEIEANDTLKYSITLTNSGSANQKNNPGPEFVDYIPENTTYVTGSAYSAYGTINYDPVENKITWDGDIPVNTSRHFEFNVKLDEDLPNGAEISNQGTINWDNNGNGINNATELTDDVIIDDGIDQDGDGESNDDDPTIVYVYSFDYPSIVTEDFTDDTPGNKASEYYLSRKWFETSINTMPSSSFEVAQYYHYSTYKSFKTKLRLCDSPQYWYYHLNNLENAKMIWWEIWFTCGDTSEDYDLYLSLQTDLGQDIAKIKFDYNQNASKPMDWVLGLFYWDPLVQDWCKLNSDFFGGYLRNSWYKLRIEKNGENLINYTLSRVRRPLLDHKVGGALTASFSDFEQVKWNSTMNPTVCPMFFWDEHKIGIIY